jgi:hypothetical protein
MTTGSSITFGHETGDGGCSEIGTSTWKKSGKTFKFTGASDPAACAGRRGVLTHPFAQE